MNRYDRLFKQLCAGIEKHKAERTLNRLIEEERDITFHWNVYVADEGIDSVRNQYASLMKCVGILECLLKK